MPWRSNIAHRHRQPEFIDQPDLDETSHHQALRGLERINAWSGSARILWPAIRALAWDRAPMPVRVLDVATGGGDVPIRLWHKARNAGLRLHIEGCDVSPCAVAYARKHAEARAADVRFFECNALLETLAARYDVVMSSLFLHHLDEEQAVEILRRMAGISDHLVLINDLVRGRAGFWLAYFGTRLLSRSTVVHCDGPRSVEGAFTLREVRTLASQAGLGGATVSRRWPCRYLLTWRREPIEGQPA